MASLGDDFRHKFVFDAYAWSDRGVRQLRRLFGRMSNDFLCEGEPRILRRSDSVWEMTSGKRFFSISGSTLVLARVSLKLNFTHFPNEGGLRAAIIKSEIHHCIGGLVCVVLQQSWVRILPAPGLLRQVRLLGVNSLLDCVADAVLLTCWLLGTESGTGHWEFEFVGHATTGAVTWLIVKLHCGPSSLRW